MSSATVAVIIVNYNAGDYLDRCLTALDGQTRIPNRILVVDNASTDGSTDGIETRHPRVEVIRESRNTGFAAANNRGIREVPECDWVALLNPDAFADPGWLEALMTAVDRYPDCAFFGSRLLCFGRRGVLDGTGDVYHASGLAWRRDHGRPDRPGQAGDEIFSPCAAAALYHRGAVLEAGGFDEDFFCYHEDVDLGFRLRLLGHRGRYVPESVVEHVGWGTTEKRSAFSTYHGHRNMVWTFFKNMPGPLFRRFFFQHLLANLATVMLFAARGQGRVICQAKWDALRGLPRVLKKRRRIQAARKVPDQALRACLATGWTEPYRRLLGRRLRPERGEAG